MPRTIQADGRTITVPDDATPDEINQIVGPAPTTASSASPTSPSAPGILDPHGGRWNVGDLFRGVGSGIYNTIAHPFKTAMAMGQPFVATGMAPGGMYPTTMNTNPDVQRSQEQVQLDALKQQGEQGQFMAQHPLYAAGSIAGPALLLHGLVKGGEAAFDTTRGAVRGTLRNATDTTPHDVAGIVSDTSDKNAAATARVADINSRRAETDTARAKTVQDANDRATAQAAADHARALQDHAAKSQSVQDSNAAAQAEFDAKQARANEIAKAAQDQTTQRGQLARQVQEQSARLVNRIQTVMQSAKSRVDGLYANVRQGTAGATVEPSELVDAVQTAENKIKGSSESIKIFRDILSKQPEEEAPPAVEYQGAQIPKGHPLYDVVLSMSKEGTEQPPPMGFSDLQGYYSELGDKLSGGNLPGDVYQALKSLQSNIGSIMQKMASDAGVGSQLKSAQGLYRDYMQTFKENTGPNHSGSPIAASLLAKDPAFAIKPLSAEETAARVRNDLARFDTGADVAGGAAKLYDNFRQSLRDFDATSKLIKVPPQPKPPKLADVPAAPEPPQPKLKPVPEPRQPLTAKTTDLTPESLEKVKGQRILKEAEEIKKSKSWLVSSIVAYDIIRSGLTGSWGHVALDVAARALYSAGKQGVAEALADPRIVARLSKLTPEDYAAIQKLPPEQRTAFAHSMAPTVQEMQSRGMQVSSVLAKLVAGMGATSAGLPADHPLQQANPMQ